MRIKASALLVAAAFALPALAQTEAVPAPKADANTQKLWKIEASGIGGWGAASQAARVRAILEKDKNLKNLIFDTTGIGYFEAGKTVPEIADLNAQLTKGRAGGATISRLTEVDMPKAEVVYEISVSGLGWMNTAIETRDVLSKVDGVIRVHPNGLNGKALVFVKDKKVFTPDAAKTALATTKELRMRKCETVKV